MHDPIGLLALAPDDYTVAVEVIKKADEMDANRRKEEMRALAEAIGATVGNRVGALLAKAFSR